MPDLNRGFDASAYWDSLYRMSDVEMVSWFQAEATTSLELVERLRVDSASSAIDVGGGSSRFVDGLLASRVYGCDGFGCFGLALEAARERLGSPKAVRWLKADLLQWEPSGRYALWHDRAVFHFLVADDDRRACIDLLSRTVAPGGAFIMATFAEDGPKTCSGLQVARYSADQLASELGDRAAVLTARREVHPRRWALRSLSLGWQAE